MDKKAPKAAGRQVVTREDFAEIEALGWSGCMHDSDCACSVAVLDKDNELLTRWTQS